MAKSRDDQVHIECGERLLDLLQEALRRSGRLPPVTAEQVGIEQSDVTPVSGETENKPEWYDDPHAVLARGRYLIEHPPVLALSTYKVTAAINALALAARNGKPISPEVRRLMDADRQNSERT